MFQPRRATGEGGSPSPLPSPQGPARPGAVGGGRRGRRPAPTWPRRAADPIAGALTPAAPGGLGAGKCGGSAPSGRSAGQCSGLGSLRRPAAAATSGRALAAASPLPAAPPPRQARQARPGRELTSDGVGAEVTHKLVISLPAGVRRGATRVPRASFFKRQWIRTHVLFSLGDPSDTRLCCKMGSKDSSAAMMRRFSPGAKHLPCKRRQAKQRPSPKS